jgi:hypothetical protein
LVVVLIVAAEKALIACTVMDVGHNPSWPVTLLHNVIRVGAVSAGLVETIYDPFLGIRTSIAYVWHVRSPYRLLTMLLSGPKAPRMSLPDAFGDLVGETPC